MLCELEIGGNYFIWISFHHDRVYKECDLQQDEGEGQLLNQPTQHVLFSLGVNSTHWLLQRLLVDCAIILLLKRGLVTKKKSLSWVPPQLYKSNSASKCTLQISSYLSAQTALHCSPHGCCHSTNQNRGKIYKHVEITQIGLLPNIHVLQGSYSYIYVNRGACHSLKALHRPVSFCISSLSVCIKILILFIVKE